MFYVEISNKPLCCTQCSFLYSEGSEYKCPILDDYVNHHTVHKDCPIKELKNKQLEWEEVKKDKLFKTTNCEYTYVIEKSKRIDTGETLYKIHANINQLSADNKILEEAKKFCQWHYNKIFYEMVGINNA